MYGFFFLSKINLNLFFFGFRSLQTLYEEFNLNEKTVEMIKKLQFVIRHEVYQMKYDYKKLLACYKEFHQKAGLVLGNVEYIKEIKKAVEEIVAKSESYFTYLLVPKDLFEGNLKKKCYVLSTIKRKEFYMNLLSNNNKI